MTQKQNQKNGENKNKDESKKQPPETPRATTVVLKVDMHCDGCSSKIVKCIRGYQGVETLKVESEVGNLTITGNVDPTKLRDKLSTKMKKKVDLISPQPPKNKDNKPQNNKPEDKKPKELPVTTAVLKLQFHCQGCVEKIRRAVLKAKGVYDMSIDKEKETLTVKGTMDVKALAAKLSEKLKRKVEVIPPKKEKDNEKEKEKDGATPDNGGNACGGKKKKKSGGGGGGENDNNGEGSGDCPIKLEQGNMEFLAHGYGYEYGYCDGYCYGPHYIHAPQIFSDENPNACSIM